MYEGAFLLDTEFVIANTPAKSLVEDIKYFVLLCSKWKSIKMSSLNNILIGTLYFTLCATTSKLDHHKLISHLSFMALVIIILKCKKLFLIKAVGYSLLLFY